MQTHRIVHRFVTEGPAATKITARESRFDVVVARKMLRQGATLKEIGAAMGVTGACVHKNLRKLGLGYLCSDRERVRSMHVKGGHKAAATLAAKRGA